MSAVSSTVVFLAMMLMTSSSSAFDFNVGGRDGWVQNPSEAFDHWAERNRFKVNDTLVFRFKEGNDSVLEVNEPDYRACNTSNPLAKLEQGHSVFLLDRSGPFFFISGLPGHCQQGQKLAVVVLSVHLRTYTSPSPRLAPLSSPASPSLAFGGEAYSPAPAASGSSSFGGSFAILVVTLLYSSGILLS